MKSTPSLKALAVFTASRPIIASDDEQNFVRLNSVTNVTCLLHELSVTLDDPRYRQSPRRELARALSHTVTRHLHGIAGGTSNSLAEAAHENGEDKGFNACHGMAIHKTPT